MAPTTAPTAPPPPPGAPPPPFGPDSRRLRRSTEDRWVAGVTGGLAKHLGIDTYVLRIALLILGVFSLGFVLVAYAAAWVLLPDATDDEPIGLRWYREHAPERGRPVATVAVLLLGALAASILWSIAVSLDIGGPFPTFLVLAVIGLVVVARRDGGSGGSGDDATPAPPAGPTGPAHAPTAVVPRHDDTAVGSSLVPASDGPDPIDDATVVVGDDPTVPVAPAGAPEPGDRWADTDRGSADPVDTAAGERAASRRRHRIVRNVTLLGALEAAAVTGALWATEVGPLPGWAVPAAVLAVLVLGLATSPWWGWSWTVALLAVLVVPMLALATIPGVTLRGGVGERTDRPTAVQDLPDRYRMGVGRLALDLTALDLEPGSTTVVRVGTGIGETEVTVPADVELVLRGRMGGGEVLVDDVEVTGDRLAGFGDGTRLRGRYAPLRTDREVGAPATLVLDADLGLGALEVVRQ